MICCWILFARILLRIFASMFIKDIGLYFSFLGVFLSGFGIRQCRSHCQWKSVSFTSIFLEAFEKNWCWLFFKCLVVLTSEAIRSRAFLVGRFWLLTQSSFQKNLKYSLHSMLFWLKLLTSYRSVQTFYFFMIQS